MEMKSKELKSKKRKIVTTLSTNTSISISDHQTLNENIHEEHNNNDNYRNSLVDSLTNKVQTNERQEMVVTKRKNKKGRHATCILCRQDGHLAKNCRLNKEQKINLSICFNCGSHEHILRDCKVPKSNGLAFATCFVCKQQGHISKDCPDNPNGLYPNGGCCHICYLKTHFSRDCPKRSEQNKNRVGFSHSNLNSNSKAKLSTSSLHIPKGDDEIENESFYQVEELSDSEESDDDQKKKKSKRKKFHNYKGNMKHKSFSKSIFK